MWDHLLGMTFLVFLNRPTIGVDGVLVEMSGCFN
jgi:hypothetical protein